MDWTILLTSAVLGASIGAAAAVVNAAFQRRAEQRRWYVDHFVESCLNALRALHAAVAAYEVHSSLYTTRNPEGRHVEDEPGGRDAFREHLWAGINRVTEAMVVAKIYLDERTWLVVADYRARIVARFTGQPEPQRKGGIPQSTPFGLRGG